MSTQGIILKLFGSPVYRKSQKQRTLTEAELNALSTGVGELFAMRRLIEQIGLQLPTESTHTFMCDNKQTVRLVRDEAPKVSTKLKHVNIQQSWLRQSQRNKKIDVKRVSSEDMLADGLTKSLSSPQHSKWADLIGSKDLPDEFRELKE